MIGALAAVAALVAASCSEGDDSSSKTTAAATTAAASSSSAAAATTAAASSSSAAATTAAAAPTTAKAADDVNAWALAYTGGKAGKATGDAIKIGYVNQEDLFPEASIGINAAVKYVNEELGGAGGRPLEVSLCKVTAEEDGAKCGTQFLNDAAVSFVMTGTLFLGGKGLYDTLAGKKPVIIGNGVTTDDFVNKAGYAFETGSVGVIPGMAKFAVDYLKPKKVAAIYGDNAAGQAAYSALMKPVLDKAGVESTGVPIKDPGGTAAEVQTAIQNAGADTADVFIPLVSLQACIATYDSLKQLGITPVVVTTGLCYGTPMSDHLKEAGETGILPDGWYFGGYGYSYYNPDKESGMETYLAKVQQYGVKPANAKSLEYTGFAGPMFANLLTATKFINQIGADKVTSDTMRAAISSFKGPMMLQAGAIDCGHITVLGIAAFTAVCSGTMGIQQYKDGKMSSAADALNGKAIDVTKI